VLICGRSLIPRDGVLITARYGAYSHVLAFKMGFSVLQYKFLDMRMLESGGGVDNDMLSLNGHLLLYTLSRDEPSGNAPVRPRYNELTLQLAIKSKRAIHSI
jgi:hypothetical protein